jgi:hypothetical protein
MPQVTVYVRVGDLEKFKALPNKSEFIHNALAGEGGDTLRKDWSGSNPEQGKSIKNGVNVSEVNSKQPTKKNMFDEPWSGPNFKK